MTNQVYADARQQHRTDETTGGTAPAQPIQSTGQGQPVQPSGDVGAPPARGPDQFTGGRQQIAREGGPVAAGGAGGPTVAGEQGGGRRQQPLQFPTQQALPEQVRTAMVERLNRALADTTVLQSQAKYAHWNVKGLQFYQLHLLFDDLAETLSVHVDDLAERCTILGGQAQGTVRMAAERSRIQPFPAGVFAAPEVIQALVDRLATHDENLGQDVAAATRTEDVDTADLLNELSREVSKYRWFLEAHLQGQPVDTARQ